MLDIIFGSPLFLAIIVGIVSLLIGSFLNVVIYRLPHMLIQQWKSESIQILALTNVPDNTATTPLNLCWPASHCTECKTPLRIWHNIPLISFFLLRGRCGFCQSPISYRYPLVELLTFSISLVCLYHFTPGLQLLGALLLSWALIVLIFIDIDTQLLPDILTIPLIWLGLIINISSTFTTLESAVLGAVIGYMSLWSILHGYHFFTQRDGMGHGDLKCFAAAGAWLGWESLPLVLMIASISGAIIGTLMLKWQGQSHQTPIAFGPYLAVAMWITLQFHITFTL